MRSLGGDWNVTSLAGQWRPFDPVRRLVFLIKLSASSRVIESILRLGHREEDGIGFVTE
jgi:hypothetical protein